MNSLLEYTVANELYKGTNSLVYRANRLADNQPVILKMLNPAFPPPERVARFKLEYDIIQSLNSFQNSEQTSTAGVIETYGLETYQDRWVIILEDFGAEALNRLVQRRPLTLTEFLTIAIQTVDSLDQVHQCHVIHGDINPSNIIWNAKTGRLKLIDFGISTRLAQENPTLRSPNVLAGTLAYMSPEQTGRINRAVDYRTDFYSLGVTFFELLTGSLPFPTTDAMALVHAHIATPPTPPHELKPDIPRPLSELVMNLMAKNAEDRYQSTFGLKTDLEACFQQLQASGQIDLVSLRQHDVSNHFQIPQKLYGREREIDRLLATFQRVSEGAREMMMVSGYTGIGKSALVKEVYKPITLQNGYFISGKFDQFQRNIPYAALLQAFRLLMRQLLTETDAEIAAWREKLLSALGPNGQVIIAVIPELELIIGPQPEVPRLPSVEAENRFNHVFQNFIKVFTRSEHPLVIFLDDLQWADGASLKLLKVLMTAPDNAYLFLIGAYRDNEVGPTHPLAVTLEEIGQAGVANNPISLVALTKPQIIQLVSETLHCTPRQASPLAGLVLAKTEGNPFFINEFLKSLYTHKLILFDFQNGRWQWDLEQIQNQDITDNVVEFMSQKMRQFEVQSQQVLKFAACIGNQFDLQTLSTVYERSPQATAADLWAAISEGMIVPLDDTYKLVTVNDQELTEAIKIEYKFAHDQVQQAAYSLIPETEKQAMHYGIGQLLLQNIRPDKQKQEIFDIVNHLNIGRTLVHDQAERDNLAKLNLTAGQQAKASAAYQPAYNYFQFGLALLSDPQSSSIEQNGVTVDAWSGQYDLTLELHAEAAEAAFLVGDFAQMDRWFEVVLGHARTSLDKVKVYEVKIQSYAVQNMPLEAVRTALAIMKLLGVDFPEKPTKLRIAWDLIVTKLMLARKSIEELSKLPEMDDPTTLAVIRVLKSVSGSVFRGSPELFPLMTFKQLNLSIKYGNTPDAVYAYGSYALILCGVLGDIKSGYKFAQLTLDLFERFGARELKAKILFWVYAFTMPWNIHVREALEQYLEGYHSALESGDSEFAGYLSIIYYFSLYFVGEELSELEQTMRLYREEILRLSENQYVPDIYLQGVLNLRGSSEQPGSLRGEIYDEVEMLPRHLELNEPTVFAHLYLMKINLCYLFQHYAQAIETIDKIKGYLEVLTGVYLTAIFYFYDSLTHLAIFAGASKPEQKCILKRVAANQKKMKKWANHAPMNYQHKFYLVEAERARILENHAEARTCYDQAIKLAQMHQYLNEEALAYELAGRYYLASGQSRLAQYYLRDAHYAYQRWGAAAKVTDLEGRYPQLLAQAGTSSLQTVTTTTSTTGGQTSGALDLASVLKASQAISGEIELDRLLIRLMSVVIENAGAQRGYLALKKNGHWVIEAEGTIEEINTAGSPAVTALQSIPVETYNDQLSSAIVNYVARTREDVVLNNAAQDGLFTQDPYVIQQQPKSILCMPLINQGKLTGILYLENNLTTGAFTADRLEVLNLLSAQAAISIENASLYSHQVALTTGYSRFVPPEFLRFLSKESIVEVNLGDHVQQEMAVLFSDIRSFTTLSETMTPQENFDFVIAYFRQVSPIIRQHNGIIVKYLGDGMMAVFPRDVADALNAAIAKVKQVDHFNQDRQQRGEAPIRIGIGIHTGKMTLGTVGEPERMQSDFLSDAVNLTARLEGLTKLYGASIIISQEVLNRIEDPMHYQFRFLDRVQVKGRHEAVAVFEVFGGEPEAIVQLKLQTRTKFEEGLTFYYSQQFAAAGELFNEVLKHNPDDQAARLYLDRSEYYLVHDVPADWAGVRVLDEK